MLNLVVFGTETCPKCKIADKQLKELVERGDLCNKVTYSYQNMSEPNGRAEGAYYDVTTVPTTILMDDEDEELLRWEGDVPPVSDVVDRILELTA